MPFFPLLPFERMGEADVREEVLAPLVRLLGYRTGSENDVIREQSLRYPKVFLGRKNPVKDPELRGRADYILEVHGRVRWVLEAKAPGVPVDINAIEQAWTYANHAEVRAVYFALSNGHEFQVFRTNSAPATGPILSVRYTELEVRFHEVASLLSPESVLRDHPAIALDGAPALGPGLRAFARIASGLITYTNSSMPHPFLGQMQTAISEGAVERSEDGSLLVYIKTQTLLRTYQELNEKLGLHQFEMKSPDGKLSIDSATPTELIYDTVVTLPAGSELLNTSTWQPMILPQNVSCAVRAVARGSLSAMRFSGTFQSTLRMLTLPAPPITLSGHFYACLA